MRVAAGLLVCVWCSLAVAPSVFADTVYLKNGRKLQGIVKTDNAEFVELEVGAGLVKFWRNEVERLEREDSYEHNKLRNSWQQQQRDLQQRTAELRRIEDEKPKVVEFARDGHSVIVGVRLNGKVEARMVLDTGAGLLLLRREVAQSLGIKTSGIEPDMEVQVADGRKVKARFVMLDKVKVREAEARNVEAAFLMEEIPGANFHDGLLGMSFLKRFNFKIDYQNQELILEKR